jgi:hypothetical protein
MRARLVLAPELRAHAADPQERVRRDSAARPSPRRTRSGSRRAPPRALLSRRCRCPSSSPARTLERTSRARAASRSRAELRFGERARTSRRATATPARNEPPAEAAHALLGKWLRTARKAATVCCLQSPRAAAPAPCAGAAAQRLGARELRFGGGQLDRLALLRALRRRSGPRRPGTARASSPASASFPVVSSFVLQFRQSVQPSVVRGARCTTAICSSSPAPRARPGASSRATSRGARGTGAA